MHALVLGTTEGHGRPKSNVKIGSKLEVAGTSRGSTAPEPLITAEVTALEVEFDTTGTFTVIRGYDPAHLLFRVCWVAPGYTLDLGDRAAVRDVLTKLVGFVAYDDGLHLYEPPDEPGVGSRLGQGLLPCGGNTT